MENEASKKRQTIEEAEKQIIEDVKTMSQRQIQRVDNIVGAGGQSIQEMRKEMEIEEGFERDIKKIEKIQEMIQAEDFNGVITLYYKDEGHEQDQ